MNYYDIDVKSKFENGNPEPVRIFSHKVLPDRILTFIRSLTYEQAALYCRNILNVSISRGHPGIDEE